MVGGQNPGPVHLPGARKDKREGGKGDVRREMMVERGCVRVIEGEEVRRDDSFEYFLPVGVGSTF